MAKSNATERPVATTERTGAQLGPPHADIYGVLSDQLSSKTLPRGTYRTYRKMRADPTIALARAVVMGPIVASSWSFEADDGVPEPRLAFIRDQVEPHRRAFVRQALAGMIDFGWQGWEKVYAIEAAAGDTPRLVLRTLKPLLHDITRIEVDKDTGAFRGFKQEDVTVPPASTVLITHEQEGDNYYGRARLENVRKPWWWWEVENEAATEYGRKIAGVKIIIHYPPGTSVNKDGVEEPNYRIARRLANSIVANSAVCVPNEYNSHADDRAADKPEKRRWIVDLLEDKGGRQPDFANRLRYLDALKFRGLHRSERVAMEGQYGTKAESGEHAAIGATDGELLSEAIAAAFNAQVIDPTLALNFGPEAVGTVRVTPSPLEDNKAAVALDLIREWAKSPDGREDLRLRLSLDEILNLSELPVAGDDQRTIADARADAGLDAGGDDDSAPANGPPRRATRIRRIAAGTAAELRGMIGADDGG